jgi:formate hydrogenlyase subunit 4
MELHMVRSIFSAGMLWFAAPLFLGIINRTKAIMAGRTGPPLLQAYWDLGKLFRKDYIASRTTTWVFLAGPVLGVAAPVLATLLVPLGSHPAVLAFPGDMLLFVYVFALSRFFIAAAAMDTGSAFEGMGAAREVTFAALAEPALILGMLALTRLSGSMSLSGILDLDASGAWRRASPSVVLIVVSWFIVLLAENARVPFDDPNTHLELTMIHEVMVLDHGGPVFGLVLYGAALKLIVFAALLANILVPISTGEAFVDSALFLMSVIAIGVIVGLVESSMARLRLLRVPQLLVTATLLAGFAVVLLLR